MISAWRPPEHDYMPAKVSKKSVHYRLSSGRQRCGNCSMFVRAAHRDKPSSCTYVDGRIEAEDVCDVWAPDRATRASTTREKED